MSKKITYPVYQFSKERGLFAFIGPSEMYRILNVGSNSGSEGVCIDHYITRRMVLKHLNTAPTIDEDQFRQIYDNCFVSYRRKILGI